MDRLLQKIIEININWVKIGRRLSIVITDNLQILIEAAAELDRFLSREERSSRKRRRMKKLIENDDQFFNMP